MWLAARRANADAASRIASSLSLHTAPRDKSTHYTRAYIQLKRNNKMPVSSIDSHSNAGSSDVTRSDDGALSFPKFRTLPDQRFEQSYLASIRGYVHELDKEAAEDIKEERQDEKDAEKGREPNGQDEQPHHIMKSQDPKGEHELWLGSLRIEW